MSRAVLRWVAALLAVSIGGACMVKPISLKAVRGETIIFPIAFDSPVFTVGFSTSTGVGALNYVDKQFGTTKFRLQRISGQPSCPSGDQSDVELAPVWITRAWPDPASPAAIGNRLSSSLGFAPAGLRGQVLAAINIPTDMCLGLYTWTVRNDLPDPSPPGGIEGDLFRTWGTPSYGALNFEIIAGTSQANPLEGHVPGYGTWLVPDMLELIPYHKVGWNVAPMFEPGQGTGPAAGDIVLRFPSSKITVKTVFEEHNLGRRSIVLWCVSGGAAPCPADSVPPPGDALGELHVHFVVPDRTVYRLSVAFEVNEGASPLWGADIGTGGFHVHEQRLYDLNGNLQSGYSVSFAGIW